MPLSSGPGGRKLGHWQHAFKGDNEAVDLSSSSQFSAVGEKFYSTMNSKCDMLP
jgi:hypothetical protein